MQKNTTRVMVTSALLTAISIVLSRFCVIWITNSIRISFGSIPIILAGILFGPASGILVGATADIIGAAFLSSFGWTPVLTVGPMIIGLMAGLMRPLLSKKVSVWRMGLVILPGAVISSMGWTSYWLHVMYGQPLAVLLAARVPLYLCISVLETIVVFLLFQSRVFSTVGLWPPVPFSKKHAPKPTI